MGLSFTNPAYAQQYFNCEHFPRCEAIQNYQCEPRRNLKDKLKLVRSHNSAEEVEGTWAVLSSLEPEYCSRLGGRGDIVREFLSFKTKAYPRPHDGGCAEFAGVRGEAREDHARALGAGCLGGQDQGKHRGEVASGDRGIGELQGHKGRSDGAYRAGRLANDDQSRDADQVTTRADCSKSLGVGDRSNRLVARCRRRVPGVSGRDRPWSADAALEALAGPPQFPQSRQWVAQGCLPCKPEPVSVARRLEPGARGPAFARNGEAACVGTSRRCTTSSRRREEEIRASALQFVRKLSGFARPVQSQGGGFEPRGRPGAPSGAPAPRLRFTSAPPRDRTVEVASARARSAHRFRRTEASSAD